MNVAEKLILTTLQRSHQILENLLILPHNSELDVTTYEKLGVKIFTPETITPNDYAKITIMLGWQLPLSEKILAAPHSDLKWIQTVSAGIDYLPLTELKGKKILVTNMSGVHATPISETVLLYALYFARDFPTVLANDNKHQWAQHSEFANIKTLNQLTWTIFETGHIGAELARLLKAFHAKTIGVNRTGHTVPSFDKTYAQSDWQQAVAHTDVIVNIMPLTNETTHFFNDQFFQSLNNTYLFVNVGRGKSVQTSALIQALKDHKLQHAALDVFEEEPLPSTSPLWKLSNVLITPHYSAEMADLGNAWQAIFLPNLKAFVKTGNVIENQVNLSNGY